MDIIGGGAMEEQVKALRVEYGLEEEVRLLGFMTPARVREYMEKADIFLFTSDRREGWGAVANEAMNSGCALIADHMIGAVPYLVKDGESGLIYRDGDRSELFSLAEKLVRDRKLCAALGRNAYRTITETWNAENAAKSLWELCGKLGIRGDTLDDKGTGISGDAADSGQYRGALKEDALSRPQDFAPVPCAPAAVIPERKMYTLLKAGRQERN